MSALTPSCIIFNANKIMSNPSLVQKHMHKSKPCHFGVDCQRELSECSGAHFLEEFRVPICLFLHICEKKDCSMYHPKMGTPEQYITFMGIDKMLPTHEKWMSSKVRRDLVVKGAKHTIANSHLLREHLLKTRPCFHGLKCKNKESCSGAHFLDEYRLPICLYLEFCQEKACKTFHPHLGKTKEQFMEENNIKLPTRKNDFQSTTMPLSGRNPNSAPQQVIVPKTNTALCSFVKAESKCKRAGCTFAHSLIDLVLPSQMGQMNDVSLEKKREMVERIMMKKIPDFFMNPSYMNSDYLKMMKKQVELVDELREIENVENVGNGDEKYGDQDENDQDEKNIEEILQEIEQEQAKEEFLAELEMMDNFEEFHFAPDDESDSEEPDLKVKITINSISKIEEIEKWRKIKSQNKEIAVWGNDDDDEKW